MKRAVCVLIRHPSEADVYLAVTRRGSCFQWGLPGGKVDEGESERSAVVRETKEEVGIDLNGRMLTPIYSSMDGDDFYVTTYLYTSVEHPSVGAVEDGLIAEWKSSSVLSDPTTSPFSDYNRSVFKAMSQRVRRFVNEYQCTNPDCHNQPFQVIQVTNTKHHTCALCNHQVTFIRHVLWT